MGSSPGWTYGQVPTAGQWNAEFAGKQDDLGYTPVNQAGDTMEGPLVTAPSTADAANFVMPEGIAPNVPANGNLWMTTSGLYYKAGNNVVGPLNNGVTAWKQAANYATTEALPSCTYDNGTLGVGATLTADADGALTVDGGAVTAGQRVLVKDQVASADNGVYVVTQAGDAGNPWILTRADDYNQFDNAQAGDSLNVLAGTANSNTFWVQVTTVAVMGDDPITFQPFALAYQAGDGISIDGSTIALALTAALIQTALASLPTTLPASPGQLWWNGGVLSLS